MPELSKAALRRLIRERKRRFTPEDLLAASAGPITRLEACPEFQSARTVLLYHSLPDEVDTHALLARWRGRKRLLLPVVDGDDLRLVEYAGPDSLVAGVFGIAEPQGTSFTDYASIDVAVVPGLAFDSRGRRLGRGRGYYDRLLPQLRAGGCFLLGLCFDFQRVPDVPVDAYDVLVDAVV